MVQDLLPQLELLILLIVNLLVQFGCLQLKLALLVHVVLEDGLLLVVGDLVQLLVDGVRDPLHGLSRVAADVDRVDFKFDHLLTHFTQFAAHIINGFA